MEREMRVRAVADARVATTLDTLERHWNHAVDIDALAAAVHVSTSRLQHLFKEATGVSIGQWLRERRLNAAAEMLASTEEQVAQIAYAVGYADAVNFNHAFRLRFDSTPSEYRARNAGRWA